MGYYSYLHAESHFYPVYLYLNPFFSSLPFLTFSYSFFNPFIFLPILFPFIPLSVSSLFSSFLSFFLLYPHYFFPSYFFSSHSLYIPLGQFIVIGSGPQLYTWDWKEDMPGKIRQSDEKRMRWKFIYIQHCIDKQSGVEEKGRKGEERKEKEREKGRRYLSFSLSVFLFLLPLSLFLYFPLSLFLSLSLSLSVSFSLSLYIYVNICIFSSFNHIHLPQQFTAAVSGWGLGG